MKENATLPVSEIDDLDEVSPLTEEDFRHAVHRVGLKPVGKKLKINIMLDSDVVAWYKVRVAEDTRH